MPGRLAQIFFWCDFLQRRDIFLSGLAKPGVLAVWLAAELTFAGAAAESYPLRVTGKAASGFTLMSPAQTGITFSNIVVNRSIHTLIASGVAAGDVDGDGLCDLYFCSADGTNALYRNLGNWKFEDITASAGVACPGQHSIGATFVDVNGDGALDFSAIIQLLRGKL